VLFSLHPQRGTPEAVIQSTIFHRYLAAVLILGGAAKIVQIFLKRWDRLPRARSMAGLSWVVLMAISSFMLATYHEPKGAYVIDPQAIFSQHQH
jgi:hypothetical protein